MSSPEQEIITEAECDHCGREFTGSGPSADYQLEEHTIMCHPEKVPDWVAGRKREELPIKLRRYWWYAKRLEFRRLYREVKYDLGLRKVIPGAKS